MSDRNRWKVEQLWEVLGAHYWVGVDGDNQVLLSLKHITIVSYFLHSHMVNQTQILCIILNTFFLNFLLALRHTIIFKILINYLINQLINLILSLLIFIMKQIPTYNINDKFCLIMMVNEMRQWYKLTGQLILIQS